MNLPASLSTAVLLLVCSLVPRDAWCDEDLFGLPVNAAPEDLYWEVLRLRAAGLVNEQEFARVQRELDVVEEHYAADRDHDELVRRVLVSALRRTHVAEPGEEGAALHAAQEGRAYARRVNQAGVREAGKYAERTILIAGMLGMPTSKAELALVVALPAGGYLVGRVAGLTYKKASLLLRKLRTPEEVLGRASALGIRVQRVESRVGVEGLLGKEAAAGIDSAPHASGDLITGASGPASGRPFDSQKAGGAIQHLTYEQVKVTSRAVDAVEAHVRRFAPPGKRELAMVKRLRLIVEGKIQPTPYDLRFYTHELREFVRYRQLGYKTGEPLDRHDAYELWNNTHTATLEDYRIDPESESLFHPSVQGIADE